MIILKQEPEILAHLYHQGRIWALCAPEMFLIKKRSHFYSIC